MKRILIIVCILASKWTLACDACGCAMGGIQLGITPQKTNSFVGLRYNYAPFNALIESTSIYFDDEESNDVYQRLDLQAKVMITNRLWVTAVIPYGFNSMKGTHQNANFSGLADPVVTVFYNLFDSSLDTASGAWKHYLNVGGGIKAPLGKFTERDSANAVVNPNFQLGSGSWDYISAVTYIGRFKKIGVSSESIYKWNTANVDDYQFGHQFSSSINFFGWFTQKGYSLLPSVGGYFEQGLAHEARGVKLGNTGGQAFFANIGGQLYKNNFGLTVQIQLPVYQDFNTDPQVVISSGLRANAGFRYFL